MEDPIMSHMYSLRFRLRPSGTPARASSELTESMYFALDDLGVADDVSELAADGTYALWLETLATSPDAAIGHCIGLLHQAQELTRPGSPLDEIVAIEVILGAEVDSDAPPLSAAI